MADAINRVSTKNTKFCILIRLLHKVNVFANMQGAMVRLVKIMPCGMF